MSLGAFSISLAVKNLGRSLTFYEQLGFERVGGNVAEGWAIMNCGRATVGLFAGMFEANIMTFNPGWSDEGEGLASFEDVREIQARLKAGGVELSASADPESSGPAHIVLEDPDGNRIMFDQHVSKPDS